jgi:cytochrome d ubiquinol oxidase subunit II
MNLQSLDLPTIWFGLIGILLTGYAILDGFDLGIGMLLPTIKDDLDRQILLNAIGPVWDGNEVWLLVGGGGLFAAFPDVYATVFSGFYLPFILLLVALIFRAAAIEFRSKLGDGSHSHVVFLDSGACCVCCNNCECTFSSDLPVCFSR